MGSKLYVGGLPYVATEAQLTTLFAAHGTVESARVMADKFTGQSRGFGFVEMSTAEEAQAAITALNGTQMDGRSLTVNEAKPLEARSGGGGRVSGSRRGNDSGPGPTQHPKARPEHETPCPPGRTALRAPSNRPGPRRSWAKARLNRPRAKSVSSRRVISLPLVERRSRGS